jgi:hypothetical protein
MNLHDLFAEFKSLPSAEAKVEYLRSLATLNLPYDINYQALIAAWERIALAETSAVTEQ